MTRAGEPTPCTTGIEPCTLVERRTPGIASLLVHTFNRKPYMYGPSTCNIKKCYGMPSNPKNGNHPYMVPPRVTQRSVTRWPKLRLCLRLCLCLYYGYEAKADLVFTAQPRGRGAPESK